MHDDEELVLLQLTAEEHISINFICSKNRGKKKMCSDTEKANFTKKILLSHDLIIEILSFLPVKSLLRFKCVCKSWCAVIQESYFIEKHRVCARAKYDWEYDSKEFRYLASMHGLVMEESNCGNKYRIRNPMTKRVLDLPDPLEKLFLIRMFYVPAFENYKLLCLYFKKETFAGCKVLTVGADLEWRLLNVPSFGNLRSKETFRFFKTDDIFVMARYGASEICCIEMGSECILSVKIPETLTISGRKDGVLPVRWEGKLSLAKVEENNLHAWVLEDYKKQKWTERKRVLDFMHVYPDTTMEDFYTVVDNQLWVFVDENREHLLGYNLESKEIRICAHHRRTMSSHHINTSLVYIKGMQTEECNVK